MPRLESLPQPTVAYGRDLAAGEVLPFHTHRRAQLVYASRGVMSVTTNAAAYVVPPQQAVWVPSGVGHRIEARSSMAMRTVYVEPEASPNLPKEVSVLAVTPLLRELLVAAVAAGPEYASGSPEARMAAVILDQICAQPVSHLSLPMPSDARLAAVTQALLQDPGDNLDLDGWAHRTGASTRTLSRLFLAETGLSFRAWRQRCRLLRALEMLAAGKQVTHIALDLGYESTSAFIAMFRRHTGTTPGAFL